jgi:hypothetical protein
MSEPPQSIQNERQCAPSSCFGRALCLWHALVGCAFVSIRMRPTMRHEPAALPVNQRPLSLRGPLTKQAAASGPHAATNAAPLLTASHTFVDAYQHACDAPAGAPRSLCSSGQLGQLQWQFDSELLCPTAPRPGGRDGSEGARLGGTGTIRDAGTWFQSARAHTAPRVMKCAVEHCERPPPRVLALATAAEEGIH